MAIKEGRPFGIIFRSSDEHWGELVLTELSSIKQGLFDAMYQEEKKYPADKRRSDADLWIRVNKIVARAIKAL